MPRQNRVTPFGEIVAVPERGTFLGNRGVLPDAQGRIRRAWQVKRWIVCVLVFRGRKRQVMTPGRYTELFFLDEATALAAGHRPCAECRHARFLDFCNAWAAVHPTDRSPALPTHVKVSPSTRNAAFSIGVLPSPVISRAPSNHVAVPERFCAETASASSEQTIKPEST